MYVYSVCTGAHRWQRWIAWSFIIDSCKTPGSCWELNLVLQEHQVPSTAELLWPVIICIWFEIYSTTFILVYILDFYELNYFQLII